MSAVEFLDDLPGGSGPWSKRNAYAEFAEALRKNPGKWAKHPASDTMADQTRHGYGYRLRHGALSGFAAGQFTAAVRDGVLYVRFIGGAS